MRVCLTASAVFLFSAPTPVPAADLPQPAAFRAAFEAQYPKTRASGTALELEALAASFGLDLVPRDVDPPPAPTEPPKETDSAANSALAAPVLRSERQRPRPEAAATRVFAPIGALASQFTDREVKTSQERVGPPPPVLERFLAEHEGEISAIRSALLRSDEVTWEMDVSKSTESPLPNLLGIMRLQRLLLSRALLEVRAGDSDAALQTLEACWNLNLAVRSRPELISQLILLAVAKVQLGVLRKVEVPAFAWTDRLRGGAVLDGYLAAFENQVWFMSADVSDLTGSRGASGRILRRVGESFRAESLCAVSRKTLEDEAAEAQRQEAEYAHELESSGENISNLVDGFLRLRRYEVDAELTALVIDARMEREASRRHRWPDKLLSVGRGACPEQKWSYRALENGTARFAFEGRIAESESPALRMPFEFVAGKPLPPPRHNAPKVASPGAPPSR